MRAAEPLSKAARRIEVVLLVVGAIGLVVFGYLCLGVDVSLPRVDPSQLGHGVTYTGSGMDGQWTVCVLISSLTMVLVTGLPLGRVLSGRGSLRGAVGQGIGAAVIACWTAVMSVFLSAFYFTGPDDGCTYPSCWPLHEQQVAFAVPGALTSVVMMVMALVVNKLPWSVRAFTPVIVWIAALLVQQWVWTTYLLPVFEGPPR